MTSSGSFESWSPGESARSRPADSPLSVGFVCPGWPPESHANGVVTYVATLTEEFRQLGHRVSILTKGMDRGQADPDVFDVERVTPPPSFARRGFDRRLDRISRGAWYSRRYCRALGALTRHLVAERGVQVLEMEEAFGWPLLVRREIPIPIVVRLHGPWFLNGPLRGSPNDADFRRRVRAEREAICAADVVTAPSQSVLDHTRDYYGLPLATAEVIPNLAPKVPASERWRREECDPDMILFVGRFDWHKGGDLIIDAFASMARRDHRAKLCFAGPDDGVIDGVGRRRQILEYLYERVPGALESDRVAWLGHQAPAVITRLRKTAAITVCCSRYETFGFTLVEAMAYGCPVIATRVGALPELVQDGVNGLLSPPEAPEELAEKILLLRTDVDLAERLGRQAGLDCESRHSPPALACRMADSYRRLIARQGAGPGGGPKPS